MTAPTAGSTVSGSQAVTATAADNVGVVGVQFKLDGANLGAEDTASPYSITWNTATSANGSHTLTAVARDAAGNTATSASVTITVNNPLPDTTPPDVNLTAPSEGATVNGHRDCERDGERQRRRRRRPVQARRRQPRRRGHDLAVFGELEHEDCRERGPHPDLGRAGRGGQHEDVGRRERHRRQRSDGSDCDDHGSLRRNDRFWRAVSITADANDNVGIAGVQFKVDGANVGAEDTTAPYGATWDTRAGANGSHTLTAVARDAAGNTATSAGITVTVANIAAGPVAAYGFNESTGTSAADSSGSGNNGTLVNGPTHSSTSKYGLALQFDGVNDMVTVPDANSLDLTTAMSIEAWVRPTALGSWRTVRAQGAPRRSGLRALRRLEVRELQHVAAICLDRL